MTRQATNRLLEMIEDGIINRDTVIMAFVKYMSEDDVADMCHINEFFDEEDEEDEEDAEPSCDDPGAHRPGCQCNGGEPLL